MKKIQKEIFNPISENVKALESLFPSAVKDGQVDFNALKQELGDLSEVGTEKYEFTWNGKSKAKAAANADILGRTLKLKKGEGVDEDTTENLYIEGDNFEALKLLRNSYYNRIKMIYIDPPYNTGNDFVYKDKFMMTEEEIRAMEEESGDIDDEGNRLVKNTKDKAAYHTNWCNMIYPRLKIARDLLSDDGVIFISIDDSEVENLKKICNEVFTENNFVACIVWERAYSPINLKKHFSENHDYVLCYAKNIDFLYCNGLTRESESIDRYTNPDKDIRGVWQSDNLSVGPVIKEKVYEIITPGGRSVYPPDGRCWVYTKERLEEMINDNRIWFGPDGNNVPRVKRFLSEVKDRITPMTIWKYSEVGHTQQAAQSLKKLFEGHDYFDYPKSVDLIKRMLELYSDKKSIILDFFSGSATTAHAVIQLNAEDGGDRKFIMVQVPEKTEENSEAYQANYKNICEIGKERIRRAGAKIKAELQQKYDAYKNKQPSLLDGQDDKKTPMNPDDLDTGFKVFKVADTNIKLFSADLADKPLRAEDFIGDKKEAIDFNAGYTDIDVVYELLIRHRGIPLSSKIERLESIGKRTYIIADTIVVCLEQEVTGKMIEALSNIDPLPVKFIFRDSSFGDDISLKDNAMTQLTALIRKATGDKKKTYKVEFI